MKITVKAKPNSYEEKIEKLSDTEFVVSVKEPPVHGLANKAIINALARYFNTTPSRTSPSRSFTRRRVRIVSGWTSRQKVVEITDIDK